MIIKTLLIFSFNGVYGMVSRKGRTFSREGRHVLFRVTGLPLHLIWHPTLICGSSMLLHVAAAIPQAIVLELDVDELETPLKLCM